MDETRKFPERTIDEAKDLTERTIEGARQISEETAQKLIRTIEASRAVQRLRGSQVASAITGTAGLALFIVGVEKAADDIPLLSNPYGSILVGLILLAITGALVRRLMDG